MTAQQRRVVVPTVGNSVRVFTQPSKDAYTGKRILKDTKVSFIGGKGEFVEIKLADGTSGWVSTIAYILVKYDLIRDRK